MRYSVLLSATFVSQAINSVNLVELELILVVSCLLRGTFFWVSPMAPGDLPEHSQPLQLPSPSQQLEIDQDHLQQPTALDVEMFVV